MVASRFRAVIKGLTVGAEGVVVGWVTNGDVDIVGVGVGVGDILTI